jgi:NAD(P)-dependent dehydrogenase (short-subunit alcohol dehydrogenase family)
MTRFDGRVVTVTGAGSGIGRATARRFGAEGAKVACLDIAVDAADETAETIGSGAVAVGCDVSNEDSVEDAVASVTEAFGPPDVLCNIAGIGQFAHTHEASVADWNRAIAVNLTGTFLMARAVLPSMLERGDGVIVNTASNAGLQGIAYAAAYCASKGGVVQLTKALALEYLGRGIRVNVVAPGSVDTPLQGAFGMPDDVERKKIARLISPLGSAQPEELASLFVYVASDEARYMTGSVVAMDGGLTI